MLDLDIVEIDKAQTNSAGVMASSFTEAEIKRRALIDMLGINCAINYLTYKNFRINTKRSVYKIPALFKEFKITDIYYAGYRIDVITLYKEKTVKIPKTHVDMDILPDFYFIVQIGSKVKEAKMIGFIDAKNIPGCTHDANYYYPQLNLLFNLEKFSKLTRRPASAKIPLGKHEDCLGLFLKFLDNDLSLVYKRQLIQHLMNCSTCRANFIDAMEFEKLAKNIQNYPTVLKKNTIKQNMQQNNPKQNYVSFEKGLNNLVHQDQEQKQVQEQKQEQSILAKTAQILETIDKADKKALSKKVIDTIFDEIPKIELPPIKNVVRTKKKHIIIASALLFFLLSCITLISAKGSNSQVIEEHNDVVNYNNNQYQNQQYDEYQDGYDYSYNQMPPPAQRGIEDYIIANPVPIAPQYSPTVSKISWEAPESLTKKEEYTKFLQLTGKNVKLNLQNDLLLVNDIPTNKIVKVDIKISSSGDVNSLKISQTSGSDAIDNSIQKVLKETLSYIKPPSHGIISRAIDVTLILELN